MKYNPEKLHRLSIRLKDYDYSQNSAYFVTICTHNCRRLFGKAVIEKIQLNVYGRTVTECWDEIPRHFKNVILDEFTVMPNHVHGILSILDGRGTACRVPTVERFGSPVVNSLPTIVRSFKSAVTNRINKIGRTPGTLVWQRNYYEHVIRNEDKLNEIRQYIQFNPLKWHLDRENPDRIGSDRLEDEIFRR
jgi:REP element-mobilizing transposase RayT